MAASGWRYNVVMLPADRRLGRGKEVKAVHRGGKSLGGRFVLLRYRPNGLGVSRFAFAVPRKIGKAVVRNRWRRQLREIVRQRLGAIRPGYDVVMLVVRAGGPDKKVVLARDLAADVEGLLARAGLLR